MAAPLSALCAVPLVHAGGKGASTQGFDADANVEGDAVLADPAAGCR
jgi:hypothetical protein